MTTPDDQTLPPTPAQPESVEESVLDMLHAFDPTTALHELDLLDEEAPNPATPLPTHPPFPAD